MSRKRRYGEEDEEVGGFMKIPRKEKKDKEEEVKNKKRSSTGMRSVGGMEALLKPEVRTEILGENAPPAPPATPATTPTTKPVPAQPATTTTAPAPATTQPVRATHIINGQEMESCPVCGGFKPVKITPTRGEPYRPVTCKACKDRYSLGYVKDVTAKLAAGEKIEVLSWHQWVLTQLDLTRFAQELGEAFREKNRLEDLIQTEIKSKGNLPYQVRISLEATFREKKYPGETINPRAAYGKWRRFQERLKAATEVRPQVVRMVAEEAARNTPKAPVAPTTEAPAETPPVKATRRRVTKPKATAEDKVTKAPRKRAKATKATPKA